MTPSLHSLASHICGQVNVWSLGGQTLPLCQRCTGLYAGAAFAAPVLTWFRPASTRWMFALHAAMIIAMIPLGYHLIPQSADARTLSGFAYGVALVYFLSMPPASSETPTEVANPLAYVAILALCAALTMSALHFGTVRGARAIVLLNIAGVVTLSVACVRAVSSLIRRPA